MYALCCGLLIRRKSTRYNAIICFKNRKLRKVDYISMKIFWFFLLFAQSAQSVGRGKLSFTEKISDVIPRGIFVLY